MFFLNVEISYELICCLHAGSFVVFAIVIAKKSAGGWVALRIKTKLDVKG